MDGHRRSRHHGDPIHTPHAVRKAPNAMNPPFHITAEGDSGLVVRFGADLNPESQARAAEAARILSSTTLPKHCEVVPSYLAVTVMYDPLLTSFEDLGSIVANTLEVASVPDSQKPRTIVVPVCYGSDPLTWELGPDLPRLASLCGLGVEEAVRLHSEQTYRIDMLGFMPGFPYLSGLDERLRCPRLATPRVSIPAGSVGIGNDQTGVYPMSSPGGWNLIGRTPARLFDPNRAEPTPWRVGDLIRFEPIDRSTYDELTALESQGTSCLHQENPGKEDR